MKQSAREIQMATSPADVHRAVGCAGYFVPSFWLKLRIPGRIGWITPHERGLKAVGSPKGR